MRTEFSPAQLADPATATSEGAIRKCVHCGFCTATCPTYVLLGDELDSPRGRIYLMKEMLEGERQPTAEVVKHIDRCLSCLSCVTTCPSGVDYMHLVDHARAYIEERYRRPLPDRLMRAFLAGVLPYRGRVRLGLRLAALGKPFAGLFARTPALRPLAAMLALAPARLPRAEPRKTAPLPAPKGRVAMLGGCVEPVLRPQFQAAATRLLGRMGYEVVAAPGESCCGALTHHMGREEAARASARRNVDAWLRLADDGGLDAVLVTASGCGTMIKDYGFLLREDPAYADKAARVSALARDISEFIAERGLPPGDGRGLAVAYHPPCSLLHGQKVGDVPRRLLAEAGFKVSTPADAHLCCGSAGTYNILQPDIAAQLGARKAATLDRLKTAVVATGNVGCAVQLGPRTAAPVVHTVELLDWATGGPAPEGLAAQV
jgi:glycolate oxidase iron-sulfur subunit